MEKFPGHTLLEAKPETGRTHQIRAHLYDLGFSILSDPLYGFGEISPFIGRLALHANSLTFWHPTTGEMVTFDALYPSDIDLALSQLRTVTWSEGVWEISLNAADSILLVLHSKFHKSSVRKLPPKPAFLDWLFPSLYNRTCDFSTQIIRVLN